MKTTEQTLNISACEWLNILRAAGEVTRLRLLVALSGGELTVGELTRVVEQSQPRVSRHLRLLCQSGLLQRFQEGATVFYRLAWQGAGEQLTALTLRMMSREDKLFAQDRQRLAAVREDRGQRATHFFHHNADNWDSLRTLYAAVDSVENALLQAAPKSIDMLLDLGTGTGRILEIFSPRIRHGVGIDMSAEMLGVARARMTGSRFAHCQFRKADATASPYPDACAEVVIIHHVLHYLPLPQALIQEAARLLQPGGRLMIVDFAAHQQERLRTELAHRRLGFADTEIHQWLRNCVLKSICTQQFSSNEPGGLTTCLWIATTANTATNLEKIAQ